MRRSVRRRAGRDRGVRRFSEQRLRRLAQAFGRVRDTFGDRIRLVFKHLPTLGPESVAAAEAAQCANAQGKFWPYHDALLGEARASSSAAQLKQASAVDWPESRDVRRLRRSRRNFAASCAGAGRSRALWHPGQPELSLQRSAGAQSRRRSCRRSTSSSASSRKSSVCRRRRQSRPATVSRSPRSSSIDSHLDSARQLP